MRRCTCRAQVVRRRWLRGRAGQHSLRAVRAQVGQTDAIYDRIRSRLHHGRVSGCSRRSIHQRHSRGRPHRQCEPRTTARCAGAYIRLQRVTLQHACFVLVFLHVSSRVADRHRRFSGVWLLSCNKATTAPCPSLLARSLSPVATQRHPCVRNNWFRHREREKRRPAV